MRPSRFIVGKKYVLTGKTAEDYPQLKDRIFVFEGVVHFLFGEDKFQFNDQFGGTLRIGKYNSSLKDMLPYEEVKLKEFIGCLK